MIDFPEARDAILLVGDVRVQRVLDLIAAPRIFSAQHPLEAVTIIEREATRLHTVVVSGHVAWSAELRELLASEYPGIRFVVVHP